MASKNGFEDSELRDNSYQNQIALEERMRYNKLCDDMDLIYDDIEKLCFWVTRPTNEQLEERDRVGLKYKSIFNTKELDELYDKQEKIRATYFDEKWETEEALDRLKEEIDDDSYISLTGINNVIGGTEEKINEYIANNEKRIGTYNVLILLVTIISLVIAVNLEEASVVALILGGLLDLVFFSSQSDYKKGKQIMQKALSEHKEKNNKNEKELNELQNKLNNLNREYENIDTEVMAYKDARREELKDNEEYKKLDKELSYMIAHLFEEDDDDTINGDKFYDFRINNYNEDVERLFRKLGIKVFRKINKDEIIKTGSIKDYREFIENKVLNMDNLFFENYDEYRRLGDIERERKYGKVKL